jgi:hypothetical protein
LWKAFKDKALLAWQLTLPEWLALVEAWWILLGFYLALWWVSYDRLATTPRPILNEIPDESSVLVFAQRLQRVVGMAARLHLLPIACLVKALTLRFMLGRRGIEAQLRIGANKAATGLRAHAWVEIQGQPIGESEDLTERFKVMDVQINR